MAAPLIDNIQSVARQFGWDEARWMARYLIEQARMLEAFIREEAIECDYRHSPLIVSAMNEKQAHWLKQRADELARCGVSLELLSESAMRDQLCYPTKAGMVLSEKGFAKLQPFALARGLAQVLMRRCCPLFQG